MCSVHIPELHTKIARVLIKPKKVIFLMCLNILCQNIHRRRLFMFSHSFFSQANHHKTHPTHSYIKNNNCVIFQQKKLSLSFRLVFKINFVKLVSTIFYDLLKERDARGKSVDCHMHTFSFWYFSSTHSTVHIFDNVMSPLYQHFRALIHVNKTKSYMWREILLQW